MKVLNLQCSQQHGFEGWFGSEDEFQDQLARGLVECPLCGDAVVTKLLSAPRLNLGSGKDSSASQQVVSAPDQTMQAAWMKMVRHVMANTEDVGPRFPEEARRMHYGETEERGIRGQPAEASAVGSFHRAPTSPQTNHGRCWCGGHTVRDQPVVFVIGSLDSQTTLHQRAECIGLRQIKVARAVRLLLVADDVGIAQGLERCSPAATLHRHIAVDFGCR